MGRKDPSTEVAVSTDRQGRVKELSLCGVRILFAEGERPLAALVEIIGAVPTPTPVSPE